MHEMMEPAMGEVNFR